MQQAEHTAMQGGPLHDNCTACSLLAAQGANLAVQGAMLAVQASVLAAQGSMLIWHHNVRCTMGSFCPAQGTDHHSGPHVPGACPVLNLFHTYG